MRTILIVLFAFILSLQVVHGQTTEITNLAKPIEPIKAIINELKTHSIVALGEGQHWNEQGYSFRLSLIRDAEFCKVVNDIVVEFGSSRYQKIMDKFINGENVSYDSLKLAWQNTTAPNTVWDMPIYEEFFRAVRAVNLSIAKKNKIRVLLGDPPIDWNLVHGKDDILAWMAKRDSFAVTLIQKEVLNKNHRALLIYGDGHLWRHNSEPNLIILLHNEINNSDIFTITTNTFADLATIEPNVNSWSKPSFVFLKGTAIGDAQFTNFFPVPKENWSMVKMEDQFDALIYLGPPSTITFSKPSPELCADSVYMKMRLSRMALVPWGKDEIARLKRLCGK